ncbi:hypothetical protein J2847_005795 [Azospirillum agricola]|uniref:hypothetical protein n=1 Tax=Azospirillum agricola TaxID=1720247 RepID=UPI001AE8746E|nr:hypothetical protein [Azospirillum agricola]MBP2232466.1 hypothetical protein [Azospirillum agricola]
MQNDLSVIFSDQMARSLWAGLKTQTRRLARSPLAKAKPGDRLWVREAWCPANSARGPCVCYRANFHRWYPEYDGPNYGAGPSFDYSKYPAGEGAWSIWAGDLESGSEKGWRPSIHMFRWVSRMTLIVEEVRYQHLHDISEEDAIAEGAGQYTSQTKIQRPFNPDWKGSYRAGFMALWDTLHGAESWNANPAVVALTFRVTKANIDGGCRAG